jgi:uncharacterized Zn finger protein (UPF0148 family)
MNKTTCASCRNSKNDGWVICADCQKSTMQRLYEIPQLHRVLDSDPWLKMPERVENERPMRSTAQGAPVNLHVLSLLDARTDARAVLTPWVEEIHERLQVSARIPRDLLGLCRRLIELMPWVAPNFTAAGDLVHEVRDQHSALVQVVSGSRKPPKPVRCPVVLPEGGECKGTLRLHPDGTVTCPACDSVWPFESWRRLGSLLATEVQGVV